MNRRIFAILSTLALVSLACSFGIRAPTLPTPGPTVTEDISVPAPEAGGTAVLRLQFGAGNLTLAPGSGVLVSGTASYNVPTFEPVVTQNGALVTISQVGGSTGPGFSTRNLTNKWDLKLGNMPMSLSIEAGAYKGSYDLGGLALSSLSVKDGAAETNMVFSAPNTAEMGAFSYETGASSVTVKQIGNASPATFSFRCGAGNYTLDFSGKLQRDMTATIDAGLGNVKVVIPKGVPAQITVQGGLSNITAAAGWDHTGSTYSQSGDGPTIVIVITLGAGNLEIGN